MVLQSSRSNFTSEILISFSNKISFTSSQNNNYSFTTSIKLYTPRWKKSFRLKICFSTNGKYVLNTGENGPYRQKGIFPLVRNVSTTRKKRFLQVKIWISTSGKNVSTTGKKFYVCATEQYGSTIRKISFLRYYAFPRARYLFPLLAKIVFTQKYVFPLVRIMFALMAIIDLQ